MRTLTRLVAATAAVGLATTMGIGTAFAAPSGHIVSADSGNGKITVVFGGSGLGDTGLDPSSATLSIDGQPVAAHGAAVGSGAPAPKRIAIIALDTSGSMAGAGIAAAKTAADAFLASVPADVAVGLVTFSDTPTLALRPTTDHNAVHDAVARLQAHGETALYDAMTLALATAGNSGVRNVILLSDGGDTRSKSSLQAATSAISASKVTLDAVGFRTSESQNGALQQLATAGHGRVVAGAQASSIAAAFAETAKDIASQIVVTTDIPKGFADKSVTLAVSALAGGARVADSAFVHLAAAAQAPQKPADYGPVQVPVTKQTVSKTVFYGALGGVFVGIVLLLAVALSAARKFGGESRIRRRLSVYTLSGKVVQERTEEAGFLGDSSIARSAMELAGRVVAKRDFEARLQQKLDAGAVPLKPAEWLLIHAGVCLGTGIVLLLISGGQPLWALLGLIVGALGPLAYLIVKESRRKAAFVAQLPDTLNLMAGSLAAGYSLPQSVDAVVQEGSEPIVSEFNRALVDARLGVPIEDALESVAQRMGSQDFAWVVMAIRIQREVGGNLSEILRIVSDTIRERARLHRQVRVLSAEGRLSAWILGSLPPLFGAYLLLVRRSYIRPLFTDSFGLVMVGVGGSLMIIGVLWLRKVVRVEV